MLIIDKTCQYVSLCDYSARRKIQRFVCPFVINSQVSARRKIMCALRAVSVMANNTRYPLRRIFFNKFFSHVKTSLAFIWQYFFCLYAFIITFHFP